MAIEVFAPAKVNLTLHVTGQRPDGYHLLDSLVVFADIGDKVTAFPADHLSLTITGPMSAGLSGADDNLVLRAARFLDAGGTAALTLEKNLPVASGLGGGTSDGAAALRALCALWGRPLPEPQATTPLGADMPVCLARCPSRVRGIGEVLHRVAGLPPLWLVLVNPGSAITTAAVFQDLAKKANPPMPEALPAWRDGADLIRFLHLMRNDLELPAQQIEPAIGAVLAALAAQQGCGLARMSGSGATCFGLFTDKREADVAAGAIARTESRWWVKSAAVLVS